jgi:hypothetical protein
MEIQKDFAELLALFGEHEVEYAIVGGYALAFHGAPRMTGDLDLLVRPTRANAARILRALADFGFASLGLQVEDFLDPDRVIQLGYPPVRVDLITSLSGVSWDRVSAGLAEGAYGRMPARFIGRQELIDNKRAAGRRKDQADLEALGEE